MAYICFIVLFGETSQSQPPVFFLIVAFQGISDKLQQATTLSPSLEAIHRPETLQFISKAIFEVK